MQVFTLDSLPAATRRAVQSGQVRTMCPSCSGGTTREESLSIREVEGGIIKLSCWRASCGFYAVSFIDPAARLQSRNLKEGRPYIDKLLPIDGTLELALAMNYGLKKRLYHAHGWRQAANCETLVMPILSPFGLTRGHMSRTFTEPKRVMAYKTTSQPWLDWWNFGVCDLLVVVEDSLSACRLAQLGYTAVALLGTSIGAEDAREIASCASSSTRVYLALDRDAFDKSLKLCRRHRHIVNMLPVCLDEDIKNMAYDADIRTLFGDGNGRRDITGCGNVSVEERV